jgi:hypothetical protein
VITFSRVFKFLPQWRHDAGNIVPAAVSCNTMDIYGGFFAGRRNMPSAVDNDPLCFI